MTTKNTYNLNDITSDIIKSIEPTFDDKLFLSLFNNDISFKSIDKQEDILVSFIVPTHNRYDMLKQTLMSIVAQTEIPYEIIIINDNSSQEAYKQLENDYKDLPITYIVNNESKGPGIARNKGFNVSKGKYIVFMDDDDFYLVNDFLLEAINKLEENKDLSFVSFNTITYYEETNSINTNKINTKGFINGQDYFLNFIKKYQKPTSTFPTVFRKEKLIQANFSTMEMMNDASIYLRALTQGDAFIFDRYIGAYRVHTSNISKNIPFDFIIENIKEKYNIYNLASDKFKTNLEDWLLNQVLDTFRYYVIDSNCNMTNAIKFINLTNSITKLSKSKLYYNYFKFIILKQAIKLR